MAPNAEMSSSVTTFKANETGEALDHDSVRGRFGWSEIENKFIPHIFRGPKQEKFVSVRMFQEKIINTCLLHLPNEIVSFNKIESWHITQSESRLFNEINYLHSGGFFGKANFNFMDQIITLKDAIEFHDFLIQCQHTIIKKQRNASKRCGFIRIAGESVIPFTTNGSSGKFVPLFYLEEVSDGLRSESITINGWDLTYLKYCCRIQGIKPHLYQPAECLVVPLDLIKNYFPPGTMFEDYWPQKINVPINEKNISHPENWLIKPSAQPHAFNNGMKIASIEEKLIRAHANVSALTRNTPSPASVQRPSTPAQNKRPAHVAESITSERPTKRANEMVVPQRHGMHSYTKITRVRKNLICQNDIFVLSKCLRFNVIY